MKPNKQTFERLVLVGTGAFFGWMTQLSWLIIHEEASYEKNETLRMIVGPLGGILLLWFLQQAFRWILRSRLSEGLTPVHNQRDSWSLLPFWASGVVLLGVPLTTPMIGAIVLAWLLLKHLLAPQEAWLLWKLPPLKASIKEPAAKSIRSTEGPVRHSPKSTVAQANGASGADWAAAYRTLWQGWGGLLSLLMIALYSAIAYQTGVNNDDLSVYYVRWGRDLLQWGFADFYLHSNCDYTPIYVYLLGISALIESGLGATSSHAIGLIYKTFPILATWNLAALSLVLIREMGIRLKPHQQMGVIIFLWFNPAFVYISAVWGQSDLILMNLFALMLLMILRQKLTMILTLAFVGVLFKPQMVFALPFLTAYVFYRFSLMSAVRSTMIAVIVGMALVLPFLVRLEWNWLIQYYQDTASVFRVTSLNAGTLIGLLGGNMAPDHVPGRWGIPLADLSMALVLALFVLFLGPLRAKMQSMQATLLCFLFSFSVYSVYYFSTRMHSRYLAYGLYFFAIFVWSTFQDTNAQQQLGVRLKGVLWGLSLVLFWQMITHFPMGLWEGFWTPHINEAIPLTWSFYAYSMGNLAGWVALVWSGFFALRKSINTESLPVEKTHNY